MKKWTAAFLFAIAFGGAVWWHISLNPRFSSVIDGQVYRSAQLSASDLDTAIRTYGIRTVIALLGPEKGAPWYENEKETAERRGVQLFNIGFGSHELPSFYRLHQLVDALNAAPRPLLLHCYRGADRTGMASAIALILNDEPVLETAEKQFSWRYGIVPYTNSIGLIFFQKYEDWLNATGRSHSRENFLKWISDAYVDSKGNIEYDINSINDRGFEDSRWKDRRVATVQKGAGRYVLRGWAVDYRRQSTVNSLQVGIGKTFRPAVFISPQPQVPALLGLSGTLDPSLLLEWRCEFDGKDIVPGCQDIQLSAGDSTGAQTIISTRVQVCIDEAGR